MARPIRQLVVNVEIGTSMLRLAVLERTESGSALVGWAEEPTRGVRSGRIVHMASLTEGLRRLKAVAEERVGQALEEAVVALPAVHAKVVHTLGVAAVKSGEVRTGDIEAVHASMRTGLVAKEASEVHLLVRDYRAGPTGGVRAPLGMSARRLEAFGHVVAADTSTLQTMARCLNDAGLRTTRFVLSGLAAAAAAIDADERDRDVWLVNVGTTSTELVVIDNGAIVHAGLVDLGGEAITADLSYKLRLGPLEAEKLKRSWGCAHETLVRDGHWIDLPPTADEPVRRIAHADLHRRIEPRAREIWQLVLESANRAGVMTMPSAGVVLTGGGALLAGMDLCAEEVLGTPVRLGCAPSISGPDEVVQNPRHATVLGLGLQEDGAIYGERTLRMRVGGALKGWFDAAF